MALRKAFMMVMLALGLLLLPGAAASQGIKHSIDQQGTIHIGNTGPAGQEKAGDVKAPSAVKPPSAPVSPEQAPPGLLPPHSRRSRGGPGGEAPRRPKAFGGLDAPSPAPPRPPAPAPHPAE